MFTAVVLRTAASMTQSDLQRKFVEGALQASELRFRALIENSSDSIALFSENGTILYGSPVTTQILGYPLEELTGRNAFIFIHPEDRDFVIRQFSESLSRPGAQV